MCIGCLICGEQYADKIVFFFFKQKTAYEVLAWLEFRRVLFRSTLNKIILIISFVWHTNMVAMSIVFCVLGIVWKPRINVKRHCLSLPISNIYFLYKRFGRIFSFHAAQNVLPGEIHNPNYQLLHFLWNM